MHRLADSLIANRKVSNSTELVKEAKETTVRTHTPILFAFSMSQF